MNKVLKTSVLSLCLVLFAQLFAAAQDVTVVHLRDGGVYLENGYNDYYLGPIAKDVLIQSIKKAIEWHDLNRSRRMEFTKEINRFKVMRKDLHESGIPSSFSSLSETSKVIFDGSSSGFNTCRIVIDKSPLFLYLVSRDEMQKFLNLLQGKSARPEIDNIFRN